MVTEADEEAQMPTMTRARSPLWVSVIKVVAIATLVLMSVILVRMALNLSIGEEPKTE
jgi:hypothetical protein